jgi:hypothetical protein
MKCPECNGPAGTNEAGEIVCLAPFCFYKGPATAKPKPRREES